MRNEVEVADDISFLYSSIAATRAMSYYSKHGMFKEATQEYPSISSLRI